MADKTLQYPPNLGEAGAEHSTAVLPSWIQFSIFERKRLGDSSLVSVVNLYMPDSLTQPSTVKWNDRALGPAGAALSLAQGRSSSIGSGALALGTSAAAAGVTSAATNLVTKYAKDLNISYDAAAGADFTSAATGLTTNPYLTAIFEGVGFRNFSFTFRFSPHTEEDCVTIDNIVKEFRMAALPKALTGSAGSVFAYPHEVQIEYKFNGEKHRWLHNFRRSVIEAIDVNYGIGDQWSTYRNGFPTMIQLQMRFKEIQLVLRDDVETGGF